MGMFEEARKGAQERFGVNLAKQIEAFPAEWTRFENGILRGTYNGKCIELVMGGTQWDRGSTYQITLDEKILLKDSSLKALLQRIKDLEDFFKK